MAAAFEPDGWWLVGSSRCRGRQGSCPPVGAWRPRMGRADPLTSRMGDKAGRAIAATCRGRYVREDDARDALGTA